MHRKQCHEEHGDKPSLANVRRQRSPVGQPAQDAHRALNAKVGNRAISEPQTYRRPAQPELLVARDQIDKRVRQVDGQCGERGTPRPRPAPNEDRRRDGAKQHERKRVGPQLGLRAGAERAANHLDPVRSLGGEHGHPHWQIPPRATSGERDADVPGIHPRRAAASGRTRSRRLRALPVRGCTRSAAGDRAPRAKLLPAFPSLSRARP